MNIQQIKNFLKLSKELHYWSTAGKMNITQSALSRQIQALEEEIGVSLFLRDKRNVKLTSAGKFLANKWDVLLDELDHINSFARKINQGEIGHISIAHPDSISASLLPDFMLRVNKSYPDLTVELLQLLYENIQESLQNYKIDLAFTRQVSSSSEISSRKLKSESVALFIPTGHPFTNIDDITPETLADQRFMLPVAKRQSHYFLFLEKIFSAYGVKPRLIYESDFGSSILGLISRGLGVAILPTGFASHGTPGIRIIELPFYSDLFVSWRTDDQSPALLNLLTILEELCP
ncbi:LysR substrate-binding domain-containing protein [Mucilaginibacter aquaedulcis]|uniref:LysR substrate-binding domain-containing protein n=1 Tax=Mucilaginibacter aquaedulcis TaxID=1187081 RepID=UPI0025B45140|nr:LysR substrate-binding domain-containing protein [Mucilaginibacter aquaedulcis]MDN3550015.1 LysR substrate-binding domain-containing protein [Mucilaginibacter aquaedulcis]